MIRLLVYDRDQHYILDLLEGTGLNDGYLSCDVKNDLDQLDGDLLSIQPDIIMIDHSLSDDLELVRDQIFSRTHKMPRMMMLVDSDDPDEIMELLKLDFHGFVKRTDRYPVIHEALHAILTDGAYMSPSIVKVYLDQFDNIKGL